MSNERLVKFSVHVECDLSDRGDGAWWRIKDIVDEDGLSLGDCGIYEFDALMGFPDGVADYVQNLFDELGRFEDDSAIYVLDIQLRDGRRCLGSYFGRCTKQDRLTQQPSVSDDD
jgi:hypothetical protein